MKSPWRHDFKGCSAVEEVIVVFHRGEAVDVLGVIENTAQDCVAIQYQTGTAQLIYVESNFPALIDACDAAPRYT
jgi:hypothetical protein